MPFTILALIAVVFGLFVWMTRAPEHPFFVTAEHSPWIGEAIARLRQRYLPEDPRLAAHRRRREARERERQARTSRGHRIWIGVGAALRSEPRADAPLVERTRRLVSYEELERRAGWIRVAANRGDAWFDPEAPRSLTPPLGTEPAPPLPLAPRPADPELLAAARALFGVSGANFAAAGYTVETDLADRRLAAELAATLEGVEAAYRERYGLAPTGTAAETIVVFATQEAYEQFRSRLPELRDTRSTGHAIPGMVAMFVGDRPLDEAALTLLHEVGHLLNRRAIGPALPPWLDEGMASDFAAWVWARWRGAGLYDGWRERTATHVLYRGPLASLQSVADDLATGRLVELDRLLALDREAFYDAARGRSGYDVSGLWVRFLVESPRAPSWRAYLRSVAAGGPVEGARLIETLGQKTPELKLAFRAWIAQEAFRQGLSPRPPG